MENLGRIYVTNLGLYNEGILAGTWVDLSEPENVDENKIYSDIKLDEHYTEYVITDYDGVFGEELEKAFGNYISISQMKAIALFLTGVLTQRKILMLLKLYVYGTTTGGLTQLICLTEDSMHGLKELQVTKISEGIIGKTMIRMCIQLILKDTLTLKITTDV